jgi:hypothetical protein
MERLELRRYEVLQRVANLTDMVYYNDLNHITGAHLQMQWHSIAIYLHGMLER